MTKYVAIVTARGGSKGLPGKNVKMLNGKPLVAHSIYAATECPLIDRVFMSTEDADIKKVSEEWGAEIIDRPNELAQDASTHVQVMNHAVQWLKDNNVECDYFVLLQPTTPMRTAKDLTECLQKIEAKRKAGRKVAGAFSVCEMEHHPYKGFFLNDDGSLRPFNTVEDLAAPRQKLPKVCRQNGAIYVLSPKVYLAKQTFCILDGDMGETVVHEMPVSSSQDIDDINDFNLAEQAMIERDGDLR